MRINWHKSRQAECLSHICGAGNLACRRLSGGALAAATLQGITLRTIRRSLRRFGGAGPLACGRPPGRPSPARPLQSLVAAMLLCGAGAFACLARFASVSFTAGAFPPAHSPSVSAGGMPTGPQPKPQRGGITTASSNSRCQGEGSCFATIIPIMGT